MSDDSFGWSGAVLAGKYRVDHVIGEGGFGVVYRGFHLGFNESVAIKCLKVPASLRGEERARFERGFADEGRLLHKLSRSTAGIVQALDVGTSESPSGIWTPYIVLEWLEGVPLDRHLELRAERGAGAFTLEEAIALLEPAALALDVAHGENVAHRDIKPANLFVTDIAGKPSLKVLDFGIAKVMTEDASLTKAFSQTGQSLRAFSPSYGAPEQFNPSVGATGPWTDVFALALIFVELVTGQPALRGVDTMQLYVQASDERSRPTPRARGAQVSDAVETVLARALSVDLRARFLRAGAFWDALRAAVHGATDRAPVSLAAASSARAPMSSLPSPASAPPSVDPGLGAERTELAPAAASSRASARSPGMSGIPALPASSKSAPRGAGRGLVIAGAAVGVLVVAAGLGAFALRGRSHPRAHPVAHAAPQATPSAAPEPRVTSEPAAHARAPEGMVAVPAGRFTMGTDHGGKSEGPAREVTISKSFFLDVTEVTVAAYRHCVSAGKCATSSIHDDAKAVPDAEQIEKFSSSCNERHADRGAHPINCVDQRQARAYCAFVGKRLPTEAEWEYAARGTDARMFPWGDEKPGCTRAVVSGCVKLTPGLAGTRPVGSFIEGKSPFGALDMAGNVFEWVEDGWAPHPLVRTESTTDPFVRGGSEHGVLRGGSWDFSAAQLATTFRLKYPRTAGHVSTGFRCAKSAD